MSFRNDDPDYSSVQDLIRRARLERSVAMGNLIAAGIARTWEFMKKTADAILKPASMLDQESAEHDRNALEGDPFLKRSVPHR